MVKRRQFLGYAGAAGAALTVTLLPGLRSFVSGSVQSKDTRRAIKLSPVPGLFYTETTLAFMSRARFVTPRQAIYGMKDPNIPFLIEHVPN